MPPKRKWSSSEKREVGFRQQWKCKRCESLLPSTFEIDHVNALHNGGEDCIHTNAEALCNQCHAAKTLRERIEWETATRRGDPKSEAGGERPTRKNHCKGTDPCLMPSPGRTF